MVEASDESVRRPRFINLGTIVMLLALFLHRQNFLNLALNGWEGSLYPSVEAGPICSHIAANREEYKGEPYLSVKKIACDSKFAITNSSGNPNAVKQNKVDNNGYI